MRIFSALALSALLSACGGSQIKDCSRLAGPGWAPLAAPPAAAGEILALENLPPASNLVWLSKGPDHVMVCDYSSGLVTPACGGSKAYEFAHDSSGKWVSRGAMIDFCDEGNR